METPEPPSRVVRHVSWDAADWERIEEAARIRAAEQHLDLSPTDIIKSATRKEVAAILGSESA